MKNKFKKIIKTVVIIIVSLILLPFVSYGILLITVPISRSNESVRNYVFRQIPIGTRYNEVVEIIDNHDKWEIIRYIDNGLVLRDNYRGKDPSKASVEKYNLEVIGEKMILIELGEFYAPFHTSVQAYLTFDENDMLIEVGIRRDIDGF
jgi:hypothetical protein